MNVQHVHIYNVSTSAATTEESRFTNSLLCQMSSRFAHQDLQKDERCETNAFETVPSQTDLIDLMTLALFGALCILPRVFG